MPRLLFAAMCFLVCARAQNGLLTFDGCFQQWNDRHVLCASPIASFTHLGEVECIRQCESPTCVSAQFDYVENVCSHFGAYYPPPRSKWDPRFTPPTPSPWDIDSGVLKTIEDPRSCAHSSGKAVIEFGYRYYAHSLCIPTERPPSVFG